MTTSTSVKSSLMAAAIALFMCSCGGGTGDTKPEAGTPKAPEWIMNMILHTDWMLENDTAAQNLVELTKSRMTDQQLTKDQARDMLELMRTL